MDEKGKVVAPNTVAFERFLEGLIGDAWAHLTDPQLLSGWLAAEAQFEPRLGGAVHFQFDEKGESGIITRWEPPRTLAYTWNEGGATSHVTFELEQQGTRVMLRLTHEKLPGKNIGDFCAGWHAHLDALANQIATGRRETRPEHLDAYWRVRPDYGPNA